jgi:hypothetical protein
MVRQRGLGREGVHGSAAPMAANQAGVKGDFIKGKEVPTDRVSDGQCACEDCLPGPLRREARFIALAYGDCGEDLQASTRPPGTDI